MTQPETPSHTLAHEINGRRLGRFQIPRRIFAGGLKTVLLELAPRVVVTRCEFHYATDSFHFTAVSPYFDEVERAFEEPPSYEVVLEHQRDKTAKFLGFNKLL